MCREYLIGDLIIVKLVGLQFGIRFFGRELYGVYMYGVGLGVW